MSDVEEDYDELPPITVNSSARDSQSVFEMPRADVVALQRAREEQCERELRLLREEPGAPRPAHSDSSGSEGEAALAAAVTALRVRGQLAAAAPCAVAALRSLASHLPAAAPFLDAYLDALRRAGSDAAAAAALADRVLQSVCGLVRGAAAGDEWAAGEAEGAGAWLGAASVCAEPPVARGPVRRALHLLLDDVASARQADALGRALVATFPDARARLELSDALRSGGDGGADRLAARVLRAALHDAPQISDETSRVEVSEATVARWRRRGAAAQYTLLQLAGRALAAGARPEPLLAALHQPPPGLDARRPDGLKVLVAASKLQVLFHARR